MLVESSALEMSIGTATQMMGAVPTPPRLNFAQVCLWCGTRNCVAQECIDGHAGSVWAVCKECEGFGTLVSCRWCCSGVVEMADAQVTPRMMTDTVDAFETRRACDRDAKLTAANRVDDGSYEVLVALMPSYLVAR